MRARMAAGRSVASWNRAVERAWPGLDAELAEAFGELVGADGAAGLPAGEQPGRGSLVADGGVAAAGGDELPDQAGEGLGKHDGLAAEAQPHLAVAGVDVAEGEAADGRGPLGVEQDEQPGDAVLGLDGCRRGAAGGPGPSGPRCRGRAAGRPT